MNMWSRLHNLFHASRTVREVRKGVLKTKLRELCELGEGCSLHASRKVREVRKGVLKTKLGELCELGEGCSLHASRKVREVRKGVLKTKLRELCELGARYPLRRECVQFMLAIYSAAAAAPALAEIPIPEGLPDGVEWLQEESFESFVPGVSPKGWQANYTMVSNVGSATGRKSLLIDRSITTNRLGWATHYPPRVTNGWAVVAFSFRIEGAQQVVADVLAGSVQTALLRLGTPASVCGTGWSGPTAAMDSVQPGAWGRLVVMVQCDEPAEGEAPLVRARCDLKTGGGWRLGSWAEIPSKLGAGARKANAAAKRPAGLLAQGVRFHAAPAGGRWHVDDVLFGHCTSSAKEER